MDILDRRSSRGLRVRAGALLVLLLVAGCGGGSGGGPEDRSGGLNERATGAVTGRIFAPSFSRGVVFEQEPNDGLAQATLLGSFHVGERLTVVGSCSADGGSDPYDGYQLEVLDRARVDVTFQGPTAPASDLRLGLYDPATLQFVKTFALAESPATVSFLAKGSLDLVVLANQGGGKYQLLVQFLAPADPIPELEPNDAPGMAQCLGEIVPGDEVSVSGTATIASDETESLLVPLPQACRLSCSLDYDAFRDFDLHVLDASTDLLAPTPLVTFQDAATTPQEGGLVVAAGTLLHIEVRAVVGAGRWTLTLRGEDPPPAALVQAAPARPFAPLAAEAAALGTAAGVPPYGLPAAPFVPGQALCRVRDGRQADADRAFSARGGHVAQAGPEGVCCVGFDLPEEMGSEHCARCTLAHVRALRHCSAARYAEPNYVCEAFADPNDTYYGNQWDFAMMRMAQAWDISTGSNEVIVAIIDTGHTDHPDLAGRQFAGYDFISSSFSARDGDGIDPDPTDEGDGLNGTGGSWHGTHVAGTIGAATNNGRGVAGITWNTRLMTLRALGRGGGTVADISQAIRYAARLANGSGTLPAKRADVINMSLGGPGYSQTMADACAAARSAGVVVVAAAGNDNSSELLYPASYSGVLSVSAVGPDGSRAPYSSYGSAVDLAAPGGNLGVDLGGDGYPDGILSTGWYSGSPVYVFYEGTSMAAPHVAGLAALLKAADPTLTVAQLEAHLLGSAQDLGAAGRDDVYGHGLVDALAALRAVAGLPGGGGPVPLPPVLSWRPQILHFGPVIAALNVFLANDGESLLEVTGATASTTDGADWLSVQVLGPADPTRTASRLRVSVDRAGLTEGAYTGEIQVTSNGGDGTIPVVMTVPPAAPLPPPDIDIYVLAINLDEDGAYEELVVNPKIGLEFNFAALVVGNYQFIASTDFDRDGILCEEGEYCGAFPVLGDPSTVEVFQDLTWINVNFEINRVAGLDLAISGAGPRRTYRRPGTAGTAGK